MPRWGQRAGTGGPHARHVGSGASERSGTVGTSRVRHAEPRGSAQRGRSVHATHVRETRPRGSRRACPSWGHTCHLEPRRSGRGVRVGTRGARVSRAFTRVTGVAHTCVTRTGLALPLGSRVSPPPPHASLAPLRDNVQRRRASPQVTRVTPKAAGRPRGAHRGGCKARHAPTRVYGTYPRGRTRGGRTWDRRGAPPACGRWCGSGPASGWKARGPRARKRSVGTRVRLACAKPVPCHREGGRTVGRTNPPSRPPHHQKQPQGLPRTPYVLSMF